MIITSFSTFYSNSYRSAFSLIKNRCKFYEKNSFRGHRWTLVDCCQPQYSDGPKTYSSVFIYSRRMGFQTFPRYCVFLFLQTYIVNKDSLIVLSLKGCWTKTDKEKAHTSGTSTRREAISRQSKFSLEKKIHSTLILYYFTPSTQTMLFISWFPWDTFTIKAF